MDVVTKKLDTESPTLSRLGRNLILLMTVITKGNTFIADIKAACLQADDIFENEQSRIFGIPSADMRRRLERMAGVSPHKS